MFWRMTNCLIFFPNVSDCQFHNAEDISFCASAGPISQLSTEKLVDLLLPRGHSGWGPYI